MWYVASFIEAHKKATTYKSCTNSFQKCGIFPFNPDEPLSNPFIQNRGNTGESETQTRNRLNISGKLLTSDETFNEIIDYYASKCYPNPFTYGYESLYNCFIKWKNSDVCFGRLLTKLTPALVNTSFIDFE